METKKLSDEEKIRLAKNEYQRQWRAKNRQKIKRSEDNFWLRRYEKMQSQIAGAVPNN